jgi:glycosyltransferase involved in cell wall biosynthesis
MIRKALENFFSNDSFVVMDHFNPFRWSELLIADACGQKPNLVLQGGVLAQLANCQSWPVRNMRLWVLSQAMKNLLITIYGLEEREIGVIPRYTLFPLRAQFCYSKHAPLNFIYAGRITPEKGVLHLLHFVSRLQMTTALDASLTLCGDLMSTAPPNSSWSSISKAEWGRTVSQTLQQLPWKKKPQIVSGLGPTEWINLKRKNPIYINFSQSTHEDFGVSLAQAQALGWPAVLSSWGAHLDTIGTIRIANFSIESRGKKIATEATEMAKDFEKYWCLKTQARPVLDHSIGKLPDAIDIRRLVFLNDKVNTQYPNFSIAAKVGFKDYSHTVAGKKLFLRWQQILAHDFNLD